MTLKTVLLVLLTGAILYGLHRLAIWAEDRGWIYYRKGRGRNWSAGAAAQELQALLQPSSRHVVEQAQQEELERQEDGESADF